MTLRQDKKVSLHGLALLGCLAGAVTCFAAVHIRRVHQSRSPSGKRFRLGINQISTKEVYIRSTNTDCVNPSNENANGSLKSRVDEKNQMTALVSYSERSKIIRTDLLNKGHREGGKLLICLVGLPGRGKTYITRKVARYLRWIGYNTRAFSLARYRIDQCGGRLPASFYDHDNEDNLKVS